MRRLFVLLLTVVLLGLTLPAYASGGHYVTAITSITPKLNGLIASVTGESGEITVVNTTGASVVIGGYQREPFVRIDATGVWENKNSPAVYLDQTTTIGEIPQSADANKKPVWTTVDAQEKYTWHDHRIHWMSAALPAEAQADPGHARLIANWTIPLEVAGKPGAIRGTLTYEPGSNLTTYLIYGVVGFVIVAFIYIQFFLQPRRAKEPASGAQPPAE